MEYVPFVMLDMFKKMEGVLEILTLSALLLIVYVLSGKIEYVLDVPQELTLIETPFVDRSAQTATHGMLMMDYA